MWVGLPRPSTRCVDLGCSASARASNTLTLSPPFPPAACWWALTQVRVGHTGLVIRIKCQRVEHLLEDTLFVPPSEPTVNGTPRAESLWQVSPWQTRLRDEDDRVQEMRSTTPLDARPIALGGSKMFDSDPVDSGQLVSAHHNGRSRDDLPVDPSAPSDSQCFGIFRPTNFGMSEFADTP